MKLLENPCSSCSGCAGDFRQCSPYPDWLQESWQQYQRYVPRDYWDHRRSGEKLKYVHPDVLRRYLQDGPCRKCPCSSGCDIPCGQYLCWWDARVTWLKWILEHKRP